MTTEGTPEPTLRYFNRYVESQNGQITKYYWAGDRLIASRDRAFAALSEIPPGFVPTAEPPQLPQLPPIAVAGIVALVAILLVGPGRRPVRVRVAVAPARALGVGVVFLVSAWPTRAAACAPDPSPPPARHYHLDHLGSIQVITNETGVVQRQIRYRA